MDTESPKIEVTEKDIDDVVTALHRSFSDELHATPPDGLDRYWFFCWDATKSTEWNTYQFHDLLKLYGAQCRRWEEHHNGISCVVERVRDKYLMPKIREFLSALANKPRYAMTARPPSPPSLVTTLGQSLASPPCSGVCCVACGTLIERKRPDKRAKCKPCQLADKRAWGRAQALPTDVRLKIRQDLARRLPRTPETQAKRLAACLQSEKFKQAAKHQAAKIRPLAWAAAANSPLTGKFETNCHAKRWRLRTPDRGQIFEFTNLAHFVRLHAELFDPMDLIPDKNGYCNAQKGLSKLSPDRVHPKGSWKGWQWVSDVERRVGNNDLLGASPSQNDKTLPTKGAATDS